MRYTHKYVVSSCGQKHYKDDSKYSCHKVMLPAHPFLVTIGNMTSMFCFIDFVGSVYFSTTWAYGKNQNMQSVYCVHRVQVCISVV